MAEVSRATTQDDARTTMAAETTSEAAKVGWLSVTTDPPAEIYIDERYVGEAPKTRLELTSGTHTLECRSPKHEPYRETLYITPGELSPRTVVLVKPVGRVSLSTIAGAEVHVDVFSSGSLRSRDHSNSTPAATSSPSRSRAFTRGTRAFRSTPNSSFLENHAEPHLLASCTASTLSNRADGRVVPDLRASGRGSSAARREPERSGAQRAAATLNPSKLRAGVGVIGDGPCAVKSIRRAYEYRFLARSSISRSMSM